MWIILHGHQSWRFDRQPVILSSASVVGPDEGAGPLAATFDRIHGDLRINQDTWEKAERTILEEAAKIAVGKGGCVEADVDFWIAGDLMNQIISSSFAARTLGIPYLGVFGACSTSMQSLALAAQLVNSQSAKRVLAAASSHRATAERQFRNPTEYGAQKPPTSQYTVTGAGAALVVDPAHIRPELIGVDVMDEQLSFIPRVTAATIGRVVDMGVDDPYNMGAAMAPAAVDTIQAHLRDFQCEPGEFDAIITGDLAQIGHEIATALFAEHRIPISQTQFTDCGLIIFDRTKQAVFAGGSGCGCAASVTYGHWLQKIRRGELRKILVVATGALLSPVSYQQGETIPCIAHAVVIEGGKMP